MKFINECDCLFEQDVLEKAILFECKIRGIKPKDNYKIYNYRGYAGISFKHDKISVHRLLGQYMVNMSLDKDIHVHHLDGNRFNNLISNLQIIRNSLHTKEHNLVQYVSLEKLRNNQKLATEKVKRHDVTTEKVIALRKKGLTIGEIAEKLNCGLNTVNRRLGMKDY